MFKKLLKILILFLWISPGLANDVPKIMTSFSVLQSLVQSITEDTAEVESIVDRDQDPHVYVPTPQDVIKVMMSDVIFINGLGFEGWINRLLSNAEYYGKLYTVSQGLEKIALYDNEKNVDPHAWHSPLMVSVYLKNIYRALIQHFPHYQDKYRNNYRRTQLFLKVIHIWAKHLFQKIPKTKRKVITNHDAFQYFGKTYDIQFLAPLGISTEYEASAKDIAQLIDQIRNENIRGLFFENIASNTNLLKQIAKETNLSIRGTLFSDALPANETYGLMFMHNTYEIYQGLHEH